MINTLIRSPALYITLPILALLASSHQAHAEIYKWRDNRGVTQYSDRPPVSSFTKITRNEMINALQTKDLCTVGPIQKSAASSSRNLSGLFNIFGSNIKGITNSIPFAKAVASTNNAITPNSNTLATTNNPTPTVKAATANQYSGLKPAFSFNSQGKSVTVFGSPTKNFFPNKLSPTTITAPATVQPTIPAPVVAAPAITLPAPAPVQVATNNVAPTTTSPTNSAANLIQVGLMPAVDISKNMKPEVGYNTLRIGSTTEVAPNSSGEFRVSCLTSHMSNDDPIVYPNQPGAAHHHTFFGNTTTNYKSNVETFASVGNSTCSGGTMNRSAYWVPSMIDTATNTPIVPSSAIFYYKTGGVDGTLIKAPPKGLRMIAGNSKASSEADVWRGVFSCLPGPNSKRNTWPWHKGIPKGADCEAGDSLTLEVLFPQCWDGKNLDSPNHQDHMTTPSHRPVAPPNDFYCPASHPVALPQIAVHVLYSITSTNQTANWRLASDNYAKTSVGGYSAHADWVNGWDEPTMAGIVKNCLNGKKDAHAHLLCDGRMFY